MHIRSLKHFRILLTPSPFCLQFHATSLSKLPICICFRGTPAPPCADIMCTCPLSKYNNAICSSVGYSASLDIALNSSVSPVLKSNTICISRKILEVSGLHVKSFVGSYTKAVFCRFSQNHQQRISFFVIENLPFEEECLS